MVTSLQWRTLICTSETEVPLHSLPLPTLSSPPFSSLICRFPGQNMSNICRHPRIPLRPFPRRKYKEVILIAVRYYLSCLDNKQVGRGCRRLPLRTNISAEENVINVTQCTFVPSSKSSCEIKVLVKKTIAIAQNLWNLLQDKIIGSDSITEIKFAIANYLYKRFPSIFHFSIPLPKYWFALRL